MPAEAQGARKRREPWRRMRRKPLALASLAVLLLLTGASLATLPFSARWYNVQGTDIAVRRPPSAAPIVPIRRFMEAGRRSARAKARGSSAADRVERGRIDPAVTKPHVLERAAYAATSWLGHDDLGRSVLYRILPAFVVSFAIGVAAAAMAVVVGTAWGAVAALWGGLVDSVMMRIVDVLYGLPYILMAILLKVALTRPLTAMFGGQSKFVDLLVLLLAIGGVSWLTMARVIRGQVLSLRAQPFVEAARAAGAGPRHIIRRHLLPNLVGPISVYATLVVPQAILQESFLSFLGIGVQQPVPSLGRLAADGVEAVNTFVGFWWLLVFPCGLLVITLLALNFIGDGLRDAYDPKSTAATLV